MELKGDRVKSIRQNKLLDNAFDLSDPFWLSTIINFSLLVQEPQAFRFFMQII